MGRYQEAGLMALISTFLPSPAPYSVSVGHKEVIVPVEKKQFNRLEDCDHPRVEILTFKVVVLGGGTCGG